MAECLDWQQRACSHAQAAASPEVEALALGGLADAYYGMGYLLSSQDAYTRCVALAEEHGLGRIAVANRVQIGSLGKYRLDLQGGLEGARRAIDFAGSVRHRRAELLAHLSAAFLLMETGAAEEMLGHVERAEALAGELESRRFMPRPLHYRAKAHQLLGDRERARELLEEAYRLCRDEPRFVGPSIAAALALASDDRQARRRLLREARALLAQGALFHNTVEYHRDAIEVALAEQEPERVRHEADALEAAMAHEPTPFTDCLVERGRLLARRLEGDDSADNRAQLEDLRDRLRAASFVTLVGRIADTLRDGP